jgi:hypothetical protein
MIPKLLAALAVAISLVASASAEAACTGDCSNELLDNPLAVEKYVKSAWKALGKCANNGEPACPTVCALPDATADPYLLGASCRDLLECELQELAGDAYGATWDVANGCALAAATACGEARGGAAGKLTTTKLNRRRKSKTDHETKDIAKCVAKANKAGACDGETLCAATGAWIRDVVPIRLHKGGYQYLPFTAAGAGEGRATLTLSAEAADWETRGAESVVIDYDVDGVPFGTIVVYDGANETDYRVQLGALTAGAHTIGLRHDKKLSPASDSPVLIQAAADVTVETAGSPGYDPLRFAPVLLGIDTDLNQLGFHPGNALSDVPVVEYVRASAGPGMTTYRYVMIWSNEDGGTGLFIDQLMAQYGRTTDIENIVEVDVDNTGNLLEVRFRPDESGSLTVFAGSFFGTHPIVRTSTPNGLIQDDGDSTLKFFIAPFEFDDSGVPREQGMDLDPAVYRVMAKEVIREAKIEPVPNPNVRNLSDERNYLFVEYDIDVDVSGKVLRAYAVVDGTTYSSDHFTLVGRVGEGTQRTAVELPAGTAIGDVTEYGMQGVQAMSGTLYRCDAFMLEPDDFLPGTRLTFSGALFTSGATPVWTVTP